MMTPKSSICHRPELLLLLVWQSGFQYNRGAEIKEGQSEPTALAEEEVMRGDQSIQGPRTWSQ